MPTPAPQVCRVNSLFLLRKHPMACVFCQVSLSLLDSDPADEIIAAISLVHRVPLMTRDRKMRRSKLVPIASKSP
jgi:PIN domain nuclease of toxin-antitoxin system